MSAGLLAPWPGLLDAAGGPTLWCRDVRRAARSVDAVDTGVATCARTPGPPALVTRPLLGDALDECTGGLREPTRADDVTRDARHGSHHASPDDASPRSGARSAAVTRPRGDADGGAADGGRDDRGRDGAGPDLGPSTACRPRGSARTAGPTPPPPRVTAAGGVRRVLQDLCPPSERPTERPTEPRAAPTPAPARTPTGPAPAAPRPAVPLPPKPAPPAGRPRAPRPTAVPSVRTGPRSAPLPPADCGEDLTARVAGRVARRIGGADLPGLAAHRSPRGADGRRAADGEGALRGVLDRLAQGADVVRTGEAVAVPGGRAGDRPLALGAPDGRVPGAGRRGGESVVTDESGGRPGPVPGGAPAPRGALRDRAGVVGPGEGTDPVLRAPDGRPAAAGLPELPDRPGRLVALGGAGLDDPPHDGSTTGPAPSVLAGTLGTAPLPTAWDSSGVGGVGGSLPAVSAPVLERLIERVLDDAARRHGIEV